ncbi:MAG: hypothetical protein HKP44_12320 [Desulfofustis sp.]|nr:hypothetical protein [Desulfofustis sp.]
MMSDLEKFQERSNLLQPFAMSRSRGWSYVLGWTHRITGLFLLFYLLLHINTLSTLTEPEVFTARMAVLSGPFFSAMEWLLAVPVIVHSLNGGRLLVYELFTTDYDDLLRSWVGIISVVYLLLLGYFMYLGDQSASPMFFWFSAMAIGLILSYTCARRLLRTRGSIFWKMQRLSGALLFVLVPAHMLFMHLNHSVGRDVQVITARLSQSPIAVIDGILLILVLYHGGYGLVGIMKDYFTDRRIINTVSWIALLILVMFGLQGVALLSSF